MAAPRAVQFIALRNLQRSGAASTRQQTRSLHMTGPATYASPFLSSQRGNPNVDISSNIRPTPKSASKSKKSTNNKNFNTSRTLKSPNDSSPMDLSYLPSILASSDVGVTPMQIPILPSTDSKTAMNRVEEGVVVAAIPATMEPEISSVSADSIILPLSDTTTPSDEYLHIDFRSLADRVAQNMETKIKAPVEEQAGMIKRIWGDLVDDLVVGGGKKATA